MAGFGAKKMNPRGKGAGVALKIGIRPGGKYADGVIPDPTQAKPANDTSVGAYTESLTQPTETPATTPAIVAPVVQAVTENTGLTGQATSALQEHNRQLQEALNFKDGTAQVKGPGTTTSDSVSAHLSKGEAVLPADTAAAIGPANIEKMIEATHTPVGKGPVRAGIHRGGKYANGTVPTGTVDPATGEVEGGALLEMTPKPAEAPSKGMFDTGQEISPEETARIEAAYGKGVTPAPPVAAPITPSSAPAPAVTPVNTPAPVAKGFGMKRAAPAPLPKFGDMGAGFVRNDQTGATTVIKSQEASAAGGTPATGGTTATQAPMDAASRARALADDMAKRGEGTSDAARLQLATQIVSGQEQSTQREAQTELARQQTAQTQKILNIQDEMSQPGISDKRKAQLAEILHGMRGASDIWMPYQAKDAMGMPTGDVVMYNRVTGKTKPMEAAAAPANTPVEGSRSTSGGKPIVFKNGKWEFV